MFGERRKGKQEIIIGIRDDVFVQVLIPVFALGRAQELCILLESYWSVQAALPHCNYFFVN